NLIILKVSLHTIVDFKGNLALEENGQINNDAHTCSPHGSGDADANAVEYGGVKSYLSQQSTIPNKDRKVLTHVSGGRLLPFTDYRVCIDYGDRFNAAEDFDSEPAVGFERC
ncbi:hypothetical protein, partial [Pseudoalteromonas sp. S1650]|uniref:hypothetical protein n=1 Tax=Pseudoalteromonas sp. S1650 TaxID=579509 RepID=UPI001272B1C9